MMLPLRVIVVTSGLRFSAKLFEQSIVDEYMKTLRDTVEEGKDEVFLNCSRENTRSPCYHPADWMLLGDARAR